MTEVAPSKRAANHEMQRRLEKAKRRLQEALGQTASIHHVLNKALQEVEAALTAPFEGALNTPSTVVAEHRRAHKPGRPSKIDADPELREFILERIDDQTYVEIAEAIATRFPPERQIGKSAIHSWWDRQGSD